MFPYRVTPPGVAPISQGPLSGVLEEVLLLGFRLFAQTKANGNLIVFV